MPELSLIYVDDTFIIWNETLLIFDLHQLISPSSSNFTMEDKENIKLFFFSHHSREKH